MTLPETAPWTLLSPDLADRLAPELPALAEEIIAALRSQIPEYDQPLRGSFGRGVRRGVENALADFLDLVRSDARRAPGRSVAASLGSQLWNLRMGGFVTGYEEKLGRTIASVITGGDVAAGTPVTEQWFLDLEREAFLRLCGERKTVERIQHMLKKGKPLRN